MKSWSFSSLDNFEACPHRLTFPYKASSGEAAEEGIRIHKVIESYLKDENDINPYPALPLADLKTQHPMVEARWGVDENWEPTDYKSAWLKVVVDAAVLSPTNVKIVDHKTGKREYKEVKHASQLQLYLCVAQAKWPTMEVYKGELYYTTLGIIATSKPYTATQLLKLRENWTRRGLAMTTATKFPAKPSKSNCRFCDFNTECDYAFELA